MNKKQFLNKLPVIILCFIHYVHFVTLNSSIYAFLLPTILKVNSEEVSSWAKSVKHDNFFGSPQKISIFAVFESHICLLSKKYCGTACAFFFIQVQNSPTVDSFITSAASISQPTLTGAIFILFQLSTTRWTRWPFARSEKTFTTCSESSETTDPRFEVATFSVQLFAKFPWLCGRVVLSVHSF